MVGIKDFEMPKWCGECRMCIEETTMDDVSTYCAILNQDITWNGNRVDNCPLVEAIPKADYENRLKADMVDMLEELKSYIELMASLETDPPFAEGEKFCAELIQQKIDKLEVKK